VTEIRVPVLVGGYSDSVQSVVRRESGCSGQVWTTVQVW